jgi:hypothetical protein
VARQTVASDSGVKMLELKPELAWSAQKSWCLVYNQY